MAVQHTPRRPGSRAGAALAAGATLLLLATPLPAQQLSPYGVNIHAPDGPGLAVLDRVTEAGIGWVRIDFVWAAVEREKGVYDWAAYDRLVSAARARGLEILAIIAYTPKWATDGPEISGVPRDVADWRRFCDRAARRYRHSILTWEVWNEPNLPRFWSGTREQYWERILVPAADAIRAANPQARVAGPGLAHLTSADWPQWLLATLERHADRIDVVTHHVYDGDGYRDVTEKLDGSTSAANHPSLWPLIPPSVREVLKRAGARAKPFWLTETGWESHRVGEEGQAANYRGLLEQWLGAGRGSRDWVEKVFFYEVQDGPGGGFSWGLLRQDGSAKPAYGALRAFAAEHPPEVPTLELQGGRFAVSAEWRDHDGRRGVGTPLPFSGQSGRFWFFDAGNVELLVKVLDGSGVNGKAWVFRGALSDVEYWLTVTDRSTGAVRRYRNPPGTLCGGADVGAFPWGAAASASVARSSLARSAVPVVWPAGEATAAATGGCVSAPASLCLGGGRFQVEAEWRAHDGSRGVAEVAGTHGDSSLDDSGSFWFFDPGNLELEVKVLDGRAVNGHFWVFFGALSDVEYRVTVTDTATGESRSYHNPAGTVCGQSDVEAF
jgi:hypothetical protein